MSPGPSPFSPSNPSIQIAFDSTSLGTAEECLRKYYYLYILKRKPRGKTSIHLDWGSAVHSCTEKYDHVLAQTSSHSEAVHEAIRLALSFDDGPEPDPIKNKSTLVRTIAWYYEQYKDDPLETVILSNGKPATELSFRIELEQLSLRTPEGEPFMICGHIDRLVRWNDQIYFTDKKTTKGYLNHHYFSQFTPSTQMTMYYTACSIIHPEPIYGGIIDAIQVGAGFSRFARHPLHRTQESIHEFLDHIEHHLKHINYCIQEDFWPMNSKACSNYGGCPFQEICSKSPSIRDSFLMDDGLFESGFWNPLEPRGNEPNA